MNKKFYMTSFNETLDASEVTKYIDVGEMIREQVYDIHAGHSSGETLDEAVANVDESELDYFTDELSVFEIEYSLTATIKKVGAVVKPKIQFRPIQETLAAKKPAKKLIKKK